MGADLANRRHPARVGATRRTKRGWGDLAVATILSTFAAVTLLLIVSPSTARACECAAEVDAIDVLGGADVVFTGVAVANEGTEREPVWRFAVDGVIKGDVDPVEIVIGEDSGFGCGTDFSRFSHSIVVFAYGAGDQLRAGSCVPTPSAPGFSARLEAMSQTTGAGPPAAVMLGRVGLSDVAVLDASGKTIVRANVGIGSGAVAHCAGTTLAAVVSSSDPAVSIVDLASLSVIEQRSIGTVPASVTTDRIACLDGGRRVVVTTGSDWSDVSTVVATSNASGLGVASIERTFDSVSRAVIHPSGTVLLLPGARDIPLHTISSANLEIVADDVVLPDGSSVLDGDVSPDGTRLAMLATFSGQPIAEGEGATHVMTVELADGVPIAGSASSVQLPTPDTSSQHPNGAARSIRWVDDTTWVLERQFLDRSLAEFVASDGTPILAPTEVGRGRGLVPLAGGGVLRITNGGLELIQLDGSSSTGDPAPMMTEAYRELSVATLDAAPAFTPIAATPLETPTITPVIADAGEQVAVASTVPTTRPADMATSGGSGGGSGRTLAVAGVAMAAMVFGAIVWRSRKRVAPAANRSQPRLVRQRPRRRNPQARRESSGRAVAPDRRTARSPRHRRSRR